MADDAVPAVRASDAERERAATALRDHLVEGRLTLDELAERLDRVYAAKTREELEAVSEDLPGVAALPRATKRSRRFLVAFLSGIERSRRWRLAPQTTVIAVVGGAHLDLRGAEIEGASASITCISIMGGIDIVVPEGIDVEVSGFGLMGGVADQVKGPALPGAPALRIHAIAFMGGISVRTGRRGLPSGSDGVPDRLQLEE